jgi:hypothetical protein
VKPTKRMPLLLLLLALVLGFWLPSGCSAPEPPTLFVPVEAEFTLLVMEFPNEDNYDFYFITKKYKRLYWRPKDEDIVRSGSSGRSD